MPVFGKSKTYRAPEVKDLSPLEPIPVGNQVTPKKTIATAPGSDTAVVSVS
jgi:hypothetical protein